MVQENLWGYGKRFEFVCFHLSSRKAETVLDVGCGNGSQLTIPLAKSGYRVTGLDPHLPSIERGRSLSDRVTFIHGGLNKLAPRQFDAVIISEVLEHLNEPDRLLSDALRYLAPRGVLIVTVPNGYGEFEIDRRVFNALKLGPLFEAASEIARRIVRKKRTQDISGSDDEALHVQRFTLGQLNDMFRKHGLRVVDKASTSLISGPLVAYTLGRLPGFVRANAAMADKLPMLLASGWMYALTFESREPSARK
jgi:2-polyprenyl-3-methyl-5-hydroxy-6-metoxy-1,4-benzoquinol methylase